jgi:peptide-methionine (R)-S-oxide reductase
MEYLMKKRYFLTAAATTAGLVWLSRYLPGRGDRSIAQATPQPSPPEFEITKTAQAWQATLTPEQFRVLRQRGTERAGTSSLNDEHRRGTFACAGCELPLFTADTKFNSGTGWPSFYAPIEGAIATMVDDMPFMIRTEVHCRRCGGHLGHVFNDGPPPTGKRYCMNGVAMKFIPS